MKLRYIVPISFQNVLGAGTRSILTILATSIGFATIIFLLSAGYGIQNVVTGESQTPDKLNTFEASLEDSDLTNINEENLGKIKGIENVKEAEPAVFLPGKITNGPIAEDIIVKGISQEYFKLEGKKLLWGKIFQTSDNEGVLISKGALDAINTAGIKTSDIKITAKIAINEKLAPEAKENIITLKDLHIDGIVEDKNPYIALSIENLKENYGLLKYNNIKVKVKNKEDIANTRKEIEKMGFSTNYIGDTITQVNNFFRIFRYVIGAFGIVATIVAIIGTFNILIISLIERTQEIGILKANGARRKDIWFLFISESIMLSVSGGISGIILGLTTAEIINLIYNIYALQNGGTNIRLFSYPISLFLYLIIASLLIGLLTGLYPAARASKIKILDAIKYE